MLSGVTLWRKSMYSSVWNCVISYLEAGFARCHLLATCMHGGRRGRRGGPRAYVDFHLGVQAIVHDQAVGHAYSVGLHGMAGDVCIVAHVRVVEVCNLLGLRACAVEGIRGRRASAIRLH